MRRVEDLSPDRAEALLDAARAARHDLGKYVAASLRWLPPDPGTEALREALCTDLRATRRGPQGTEDAWHLWARLRPPLVRRSADLSRDPDVLAVDRALSELSGLGGSLEQADRADLLRSRALALEVGEALRRLYRRLRERAREPDGRPHG